MITQALGYFGIPRVSPARARVRAGRSLLAPWGGSDVMGLRSRSSTCQSSLNLDYDLAHLASSHHLCVRSGDTLGFLPVGRAHHELAGCSKDAEARATTRAANMPIICHCLTVCLPSPCRQIVTRRWCLGAWPVYGENYSSSPVARISPRQSNSLRQIEPNSVLPCAQLVLYRQKLR